MTDGDERRWTAAALDRLLVGEAVWAEPPADLEDSVVRAVARRAEGPRAAAGPSRADRWPFVAGVASALAVVATAVTVGVLVVTTGPQERTFDTVHELTATDVAPDATARVEVTVTGVGTRLVLDVADLGPAPPDEVYEGWMLDEDAAVVSAGTFHLRAGDAAIELWSGVTPDDFDRFVVTRHPVGALPGDDGPTGPWVLHGSLGR